MKEAVKKEIKKMVKGKEARFLANLFFFSAVLSFFLSFFVLNVGLAEWQRFSFKDLKLNIFFWIFLGSLFVSLFLFILWFFYGMRTKRVPKVFFCRVMKTGKNLEQKEELLVLLRSRAGELMSVSKEEWDEEVRKRGGKKQKGNHGITFYRPEKMRLKVKKGEEEFEIVVDVFIQEISPFFLIRFFENQRGIKFREEVRLILLKYFERKASNSVDFSKSGEELMVELEKSFLGGTGMELSSKIGGKATISLFVEPISFSCGRRMIWFRTDMRRKVGTIIFRKPKSRAERPIKEKIRKEEAESIVVN